MHMCYVNHGMTAVIVPPPALFGYKVDPTYVGLSADR
jgi:hypothetical protein